MHNTPGRCTAGRAARRSSPRVAVGEPAVERRARVAVIGFQGFGNVGDEAILVGIERLVGEFVQVTTVFAGDRQSVVGFGAASRRPTFHHLPTPRALRLLARNDVLLMSGGGLMNDYWPNVIPRYLAWVIAGRIAGCRVVWVGAGVGPIRRRTHRALAGLAFAASRLVTVRDEASRHWVRRCSRRTHVEVVPDPAFFAVDPPTRANPGGPPGADRATGSIGVILRAPAPGSEHAEEALLEAIAGLAADRASSGVRVELITMHDEVDGPYVARALDRLRARAAGSVAVVSLPLGPDAAVRHLSAYTQLVTVRLHGVILGALAGVPAVSIRYDEKVAAVANQLGLGDLCLPLEGLSAAGIGSALRAAAEPGRQTALAARLAGIRGRRDEFRGLLREALA